MKYKSNSQLWPKSIVMTQGNTSFYVKNVAKINNKIKINKRENKNQSSINQFDLCILQK